MAFMRRHCGDGDVTPDTPVKDALKMHPIVREFYRIFRNGAAMPIHDPDGGEVVVSKAQVDALITEVQDIHTAKPMMHLLIVAFLENPQKKCGIRASGWVVQDARRLVSSLTDILLSHYIENLAAESGILMVGRWVYRTPWSDVAWEYHGLETREIPKLLSQAVPEKKRKRAEE